MKHLRLLSIAATALLVLACSPQENPEGVIPQGYKDAVDKAQGVEDKLQGAVDAQLEALEQANQ